MEKKKIYMYIYITASLCCIAEINTTLITYALIKREGSFSPIKRKNTSMLKYKEKNVCTF